MNTTVLCVDIGSSSLKAALISKHGRIDAYSRQELPAGPNAAESWLPALGRAIQDFPKHKASAVCISGNGPTLVSSSGKTLTWNAEVKEDEAPAPTKSLFLPRLQAFKTQFPTAWASDKYILSGPEFLIWQLTNTALTILPEERYSDYYWTDSLLEEAGFSAEEMAKLPPFVPPTTLAGKVTKGAAELTGLKAGTRVYCGAPDFIAALVGTNTLRSGAMYDRAGSSEGINLCTAVPIYGRKIRTLPSIIPGLWNASMLIPESGSRFSAFKDKVAFTTKHNYSNQALVDEILLHGGANLPIPLAVEGRELVQKLAQEVKAAVANLTYAAFRTHVETPEGKAEVSVPLPDEMILSGRQATNAAWSRYKCSVADITGRVPVCTDAELLGDNIFARVGMGEFKTIPQAADALVKIETSYFPTTVEF